VGYIADVQFRLVQRDDVTVALHDPAELRTRFELAHLPGVLRTEPFRVVPVRLRFEHRTRRTGMVGLERETELHRLLGRGLVRVEVPPDGVVLTTKLGEVLGVTRGDLVRVEVLEGARPVRAVRVAGFVDELVGLSAYMDLGALNGLMRETGSMSGAFLAVEPTAAPALYADLKRLPAVGGVTTRQAALRSFEETLARSLGIFTTVLVTFACVIAVAVMYNAARIALSERGRELASLRVLGFTRHEVAVLLFGEQAILTALAIPLGYLIGYQLCALIAASTSGAVSVAPGGQQPHLRFCAVRFACRCAGIRAAGAATAGSSRSGRGSEDSRVAAWQNELHGSTRSHSHRAGHARWACAAGVSAGAGAGGDSARRAGDVRVTIDEEG